jgi:trimeric autotransporter adhesin
MYASQSDVFCTFDGTPQTITWITADTFQVPAPSVGVNVIYGVTNGTLALGDTPEQVFSYNTFANGGSSVAPVLPDPLTAPVGFNNVALGSRAMKAVVTGGNNTAVGARAMTSVVTGSNNTAVGFQAGYRATGNYNTTVGSIAGEWMTTAAANTFVGALAGAKETTGGYNVAVGYDAFGENETGTYNVAVGHRALANPREDLGFSPDETVAIGAFAGDLCFGDKNTVVGYRAGNGAVGGSDGTENVAVGFNALRHHNGADYNTAVGVSALRDTSSGQYNVSVGHEALAVATTASQNIAVGAKALAAVTTTGGLVAVGYSALTANTSGGQNVAIGPEAMIFNTTGSKNTSLGSQALRINQAAANQTAYDNTTGLGYQARVSGSNQVQLGNSGTTTYAYGAVQNRSDLRDKADVRDTTLGLNFINALRPVDFKWDYREDYIKVDADNNATKLDKDGSKKRNRYHHGLIAQEVKETIASIGVDFGGFQDHKLSDGCDVMSLGYDELIAPLIKAVQELTQRIKELEAK